VTIAFSLGTLNHQTGETMTTFKILLASTLLMIATGCAMARSPVNGFFYSDVQDGMSVTSNQRPSKMGMACATSILGVYASGDASINTARNNGRINTISSVDTTSSNILGFYAKYCVVVRGN
jgi:hypothetical protein